MRWSEFIAQIKRAGFDGDGEDLRTVKGWLSEEGYSTETVDGKDGKPLLLDQLYEARKGKVFDASEAARSSEMKDLIAAGVDEKLKHIRDTVGMVPANEVKATKAHDHSGEIKVGHMRLAEDPTGGFRHAGEFFKAVHLAADKNRHEPETLTEWQKAATTWSGENVGADGGYAVPTDYRSQIESHYGGKDSLLSRTDQITLSGNGIRLPDDEDAPHNPSGIIAYWEGEGETMTQTKAVLKSKEMRASKLTVLAPVTEELLEDSMAMASWLPRKAGEVIDFKIGEALFRGTGVGQPLGFLNAGCTISVAKASSQTADTVIVQNILDMWVRRYAKWESDYIWMAHQSVESELMLLSYPGRNVIGTTTGTSYGIGGSLYIPAGGFSAAPYSTLMGRPVIYTEHANEKGDLGDLQLCCWPKYRTAIKGGLQSASSMHVWFDQDVVAFKFRFRMDGQPSVSSAVSPRDGSDTYSPFVTLAARA
jgi:HK97 family phage major capsid protein